MAVARPRYSIDTCSFTQLRRVYPLDVFPGVWQKLDELADSGILTASQIVDWELGEQDDELTEWATNHNAIFAPLDAPIQNEARAILERFPTLVDLKKRKSAGDPFIIAHARINSLVVVTEEKPSGGPHRVKIPDVCAALAVERITVLEMLRREGLRLG